MYIRFTWNMKLWIYFLRVNAFLYLGHWSIPFFFLCLFQHEFVDVERSLVIITNRSFCGNFVIWMIIRERTNKMELTFFQNINFLMKCHSWQLDILCLHCVLKNHTKFFKPHEIWKSYWVIIFRVFKLCQRL